METLSDPGDQQIKIQKTVSGKYDGKSLRIGGAKLKYRFIALSDLPAPAEAGFRTPSLSSLAAGADSLKIIVLGEAAGLPVVIGTGS